MTVLTETVGGVIRYGKHKIPRFIYHITNRQNYESMLQDGVIRASGDDFFMDKGVFAIELTNFFKRWRKDKSWDLASLQEELIKHIAKRKDDIVILRIPTEKLNHKFLKVRSQNRLLGFGFSEKGGKIIDSVEDRINESGLTGVKRSRLVRRLSFDSIKENFGQDAAEHLILGSSACNAKHFTEKKEAIEYVYRNSIPISDVEKIGEVNVAELRKTAEYDPIRPIRSIFSALLDGTPEQKGALLLNC